MSKGRSLSFQTAYVIIRVDEFTSEKSLDANEKDGPEIRVGKYEITVKEVVLSLEEAESETKRLNELMLIKSVAIFGNPLIYFLMAARMAV